MHWCEGYTQASATNILYLLEKIQWVMTIALLTMSFLATTSMVSDNTISFNSVSSATPTSTSATSSSTELFYLIMLGDSRSGWMN